MNSFPVTEDVTINDELNNGYIYGILDFGVIRREVIAFPQADLAAFDSNEFLSSTYGLEEETNIKSMVGASVPVGYKTCLLPGCRNIPKFKESLSTGSFSLQLHTDSLVDRIFSEKNIISKRPEGGIPSLYWNKVIGKKAKQKFSLDDKIKI